MALAGMPRFREDYGDTVNFILAATPEQLLKIVAETALRDQPLVQNFNNAQTPAFYQKTDDLRTMIVREMRRHADFKGMIVRRVPQKQPQGQGSQTQEQKKGKQQPSQGSDQKKEK
jgi:hypothetical protein